MADALHALRHHRLDQELEPRNHRLVLEDDALDHLQLTELRMILEQRHPIGPLELNLIIPFRVVVRLGDRRTAFERVDAHVFLVEIELGRKLPHLLRIVAGELDVHLVDHFHHVDFFAHLLAGLPGGCHHLRLVVFLQEPDGAVVVAIDGAEPVGELVVGRQVEFKQAMR